MKHEGRGDKHLKYGIRRLNFTPRITPAVYVSGEKSREAILFMRNAGRP